MKYEIVRITPGRPDVVLKEVDDLNQGIVALYFTYIGMLPFAPPFITVKFEMCGKITNSINGEVHSTLMIREKVSKEYSLN